MYLEKYVSCNTLYTIKQVQRDIIKTLSLGHESLKVDIDIVVEILHVSIDVCNVII